MTRDGFLYNGVFYTNNLSIKDRNGDSISKYIEFI